LPVVGRHDDVRTVRGRHEDEQIPKRICKVFEVGFASDF
jgi:hypothetical protein